MTPESASRAMLLRNDLHVMPLAGSRDCVVVDDISGRFARTKRAVWDQLRRTNTPTSHADSGAVLWQQATSAGWTRSRTANDRSGAWSPLSIKIPITSIDPIAKRLVGFSDLIFAPKAILMWSIAAAIGVLVLSMRWERWAGSVPSLTHYITTMHPMSAAAVFVLTKTVHELGHATACRRFGSRPGVAGIWFLCFMPCPFVDVTEVWRQPSAMRRAAVMAAGMIAEGVVCVIAIWVWVLAESANMRLAAMNVILICGVSTVLFNANPLMRYDGYFILSDLIDSSNLRVEASREWMRCLSLPVRSWFRLGRRSLFLIGYQAAAAVYRVFIFVAITTMILAIADRFGCWRIAAILVVVLAMAASARKVRSMASVWLGNGKWSVVPKWRRRGLALGAIAILLVILLVPFPRYRHVSGRLEAKDVKAVYLPGDGMVESVEVRVGDHVLQDQRLATLTDPELEIRLVSINGQAKVLKHRSRAARLASLSGDKHAMSGQSLPENQWDVLDAASLAVSVDRDELLERQQRLRVVAPVDGWVLPGVGRSGRNQGRAESASDGSAEAETTLAADPLELSPGPGQLAIDRMAWCRIATSENLQVTIPLDSDDHDEILVGSEVRIVIPGRSFRSTAGFETTQVMNELGAGGEAVQHSTVRAVSPLRSDAGAQQMATGQSATGNAKHGYQAIADLSPDGSVTMDHLVRWDGAECQVVVHLARKALWEDLVEMTRDVIGR
ncbi:putative peptide zinc metalloprotease protein [Neorhodopirellula lusitana]|uniref:Peptide zinc metalloprotease protein n=2 Tax=Neorhodopirellula lusitana TaxID=445327 RepID=A0ABY1QPI6_9BACT|nr:putative peptide zinc metalloprotease protein [Neorhodopirellula lusitana]